MEQKNMEWGNVFYVIFYEKSQDVFSLQHTNKHSLSYKEPRVSF